MQIQLEICCFNIQSCIQAEAAGATRIELCANHADGGTTPSYGIIKMVKEKISIPVHPIIRPRGGDFFFDEDEFNMMKTDILLCKQLGCEGVVIGMLQQNGTINKTHCARMVNLAYPMSVTFHRAFDRAIHPLQAMEDIIDIGCERILTSGQQPTAMEGIAVIKEMIEKAANRIIIMPGAGVCAANIIELAKQTNAKEFHSSAKIFVDSKMQYVNKNMGERLQYIGINSAEIIAMKASLANYINA